MRLRALPLAVATVILLFSNGIFAQNYSWVGTLQSDQSVLPRDMVIPPGGGYVLMVGQFRGQTDFDFSASDSLVTSVGGTLGDIFIAKYEADGTFVWVKTMGSTGTDEAYSVETDTAGNIYITGQYDGTVDFDPGAGTANLTSTSSDPDIYVAKYDQDGNYIWAKGMEGGGNADLGYGVAVDSEGGVYFSGTFTGTVDFDPGAGTANVTSTGGKEGFLAKVDKDGNYEWAFPIGGADPSTSKTERAYEVVVDKSDNVIVTGEVYGDDAGDPQVVDYDPGGGSTTITHQHDNDGYVAKYDKNGNFIWVKGIGQTTNNTGSTRDEYGYDVKIGPANSVYIAGSYAGKDDATYFDLPTASVSRTSVSINDNPFVAKYDANGNLEWVSVIPMPVNPNRGEGFGCAVDRDGDVYLTGYFNGTNTDFDPGTGTAYLTSPGSDKMFLAKYSSADGSYQWAVGLQDNGLAQGYAIALDSLDNGCRGSIYVAGYFQNTVDFDPDPVTQDLVNQVSGASDGFLWKYGELGPPLLDAGFTATSVCQGDTAVFVDTSVVLSGSITNWNWDFNDGNDTTVQHPNHVFNGAGTFNVDLEVISTSGCRSTATLPVTVSGTPDAGFIATNPCLNQAMTLTDTSLLSVGLVTQREWDFGDGTGPLVGNDSLTNYTYANDSAYVVTLIVTSNVCSDTISDTVRVNALPEVGFTSVAACPDSTISFTDTSIIATGNVTGWNWDFGDGSSSSSQNPTHTYPVSDTSYAVKLIALSDSGCTDSVTLAATVYAQPQAFFVPPTVCAGDTMPFVNGSTISSGTIVSWEWDFGDGSPVDNGTEPTHIYTTAGKYNVTLTVISDNNCPHTFSDSVTVETLPDAGFAVPNVCIDNASLFNDTSTIAVGSVTGWDWDFGDGNSSSLEDPSHTYTTDSNYIVTLIVSSASGCKDTITDTVTVYSKPVPDFTANSVCPDSTMIFTDLSTSDTGSVVVWDWDFGNGSTSSSQNPTTSYTSSDTISVKLRVVTAFGCEDSVNHDVIVNPEPVASFTATGGCDADSVRVVDASNISAWGNIISWYWDFGDGNTSTSPNPPPHLYGTNGAYTITLTVTSDSGCANTTALPVAVAELPVANFLADSVCVTNTTTFLDSSTISLGTINSWDWDFGDGAGTSSMENPTYVYGDSGTYTVTLIVSTGNGCRDTIDKEVRVHPAAIPDFIADSVCFGDTTYFFGSSVGGTVTSWDWDYNDSNVGSGQNTDHLYGAPGLYDVDLVIGTDNGCVTNVQKQVRVWPKPTADFSGANLCPGDVGNFTDLSTGAVGQGGVIIWDWDFGDGDSANTQNPTNAFDTAGTYNVTLIIENGYGCSDTITKAITVSPAPVAAFTAPIVCFGNTTTFTNNSTSQDPITGWYWDFGDGTTSTVSDPSHNYSAPGTYTVTFIPSTGSNCPDTITKTVTVDPKPVAAFGANEVCEGNATSFFDSSTVVAPGQIVSWEWDFGDGSSITQQNPSHTYSGQGTYNVTLIVTTADGCKDTTIGTTYTVNGIDVEMSGDGNYGELDYDVNFSSMLNYGTAATYTWDFGDGNTSNDAVNTSHTFTQLGMHTVILTVIDANGCEDTAMFTLEVYINSDVRYPNIFTPNGDGTNDLFKPTNYKGIKEIDGIIYNRWGSVIYTWDKIGMFWDGRTNAGVECSSGTYYYMVNAEGLDGKKYELYGFVTLLR